MIIVDFSAVLISNLHAQVGIHNVEEVNEDLLRHMILNTIRSIRVKFKKDETVIACDSGSWRKNVFPYYKANRKKAKEASKLNWKEVFEVFSKVRDEIQENFPYRVVRVDQAEADDVIGVLVREFGQEEDLGLALGGKITIVSPDKDFAQLHRYHNVVQYDPIQKKFITHVDPEGYLREHILRGDSGDGVPNVMSDSDTFVVEGKRQKPMTKKKVEELLKEVPKEFTSNFERNKVLIDLRETPVDIQSKVLSVYESEAGKNRSKILDYMMKHRLRNLTADLQDF